MQHNVKIVIGANYGDEGKGLMSRYFTKKFVNNGKHPITVFHNGTAQRGHTADYEDGSRHIFHNFGAGTKEGGATFYAASFLVHPMDFCRELDELQYVPEVYCDPGCVVVTPVDMLADQIIEDYIAVKSGAREYGSCCYGSWSTTDRILQRPDLSYTVSQFLDGDYWQKMSSLHEWLRWRLREFHVDIGMVQQWEPYISETSERWNGMCAHFCKDLIRFCGTIHCQKFDEIWRRYDSVIFEGAQGILLDKDRTEENGWTTTSKTGLHNPARMLSDYSDFFAEVCYVTRPYITRHGNGTLPCEVERATLNALAEPGIQIIDRTNPYNPFQGNLRYALSNMKKITQAAELDFAKEENGRNYGFSMAVTHYNECDDAGGDYRSYSTCEVIEVWNT